MTSEKKARTRLAPADRRQQILDTAARLFGERGFEAVAMPDIALALDVARPTVYKYFPSTEAMLGPLFDAALAAIWERVLPLIPAQCAGPLALDVPAIFTLLLEEERLLVLLHSGGGPVFQRYRRAIFERLSDLLAPYQPPQRHPYQRLILALLLEEMAFWAVSDPHIDRSALTQALSVFVAEGAHASVPANLDA